MRGYTDAFQQVFTCLHKYINSRTTVPVRVTRRIVAILRSQARIPEVIQVRKTPRAANPGGVSPVESRSRACIPLLFSFPLDLFEWSCPSGLLTQPIHPAFYPIHKAADDCTRPSYPAHCSQSPQPSQKTRSQPSTQNATGSEPRRSQSRRKPI